jgi:hypothetical protein
VLEFAIVYIALIIEHNGEDSSENLTDLFREITEPLHRKHDKASCGEGLAKIRCGQPCLNTVKLTRQIFSP